ncbi:flagellar hook-basal body complex protein FliE [Alkaliphilus hydrothermalis]|uniref:Flagellar hook-basal body complex protein FliE n=1 Tax=Alkaliphilus hydrothermalis TaxID=1482730 RepID=A0ABS2NL56_9FIRM|nr:flagellar hook-basal body complex protein FliE [Alkaliphilus hydrothermalis]MBM7613653.1 flagellar hook-basal body complex protein FliE [Alkaliphilus hydrothermalis]
MKINGISINNEIHRIKGLGLFDEASEKSQGNFKELLAEAINNTNRLEKTSEDYSLKLASGQLENIHEAMIAAQKADTSLQFMMQIRNKVLDAYREITRMQI